MFEKPCVFERSLRQRSGKAHQSVTVSVSVSEKAHRQGVESIPGTRLCRSHLACIAVRARIPGADSVRQRAHFGIVKT